MNLSEVQSLFCHQLLGSNLRLSAELKSLEISGPFPAEQLLQLYRNNFYISLCDYLEACFPTVSALVGEEFFRQLSKKFIQQTPLTEAPLAHYGTGFSSFISTYTPTAELPYLAEMATLEWYLENAKTSFHTELFPFKALAELAEAQQSDIRFLLTPGVSIIDAQSPVFSIWKAIHSDNPEHNELEQMDMSQKEQILIYPTSPSTGRPGAELTLISNDHYQLIRAFKAGTALSDLVLAADFQQQLSHWISLGVINNFSLEKHS
ncbi:DNA-binding domain-containing protein [Motiliproteus sp. MSK22-1]|uniref:HvfC/BufC N-terminal domain-containing protein n=1 Tax=Motiliproteus sp. MSK22-1 TaxID=1897630 RepID=UPI000975B448|nr:DNA-binding domain-containing protein [Motiliproteus sp. MSK22-1]OMH25855.1 hypothetical protein BGP75_25410 [Motiliproteus sp. MSK22-1]